MVQQGRMQMACWVLLLLWVTTTTTRASPTLRVQHAQVIVAPTNATTTTTRQVGAALVYHHWTSTAIVAFQDGPCGGCDTAARVRVVRIPGTGPDVLEVGTPQPSQCFGQPLLAMSADGERIVLAVPTTTPSTLLYESQDQGRTWAELPSLRVSGARPLLLQAVGHDFVLVMQTASNAVALYHAASGVRFGVLTTSANVTPISSATLVQCEESRWRMVLRRSSDAHEVMYSSLTAGRTWHPVPIVVPAPATPMPVSMFLYDRARQPPGFDALAFADREGTQLTGPLPLHEAQAWPNLSIRRTWWECADSSATLSNGWRVGVSSSSSLNYTLVEGRTCRLADTDTASATATNAAILDRCLPDGTRLGTSVLRVPPWRSSPTLGRPSPYPTRVVALVDRTRDGQWPALLLERDVTASAGGGGDDDFLVDLVLSIPTSATSWTEVVLEHAMPMRLHQGYYATGDYERAIAWHPRGDGGGGGSSSDGEYLIAYSQVGRGGGGSRIVLARIVVGTTMA